MAIIKTMGSLIYDSSSPFTDFILPEIPERRRAIIVVSWTRTGTVLSSPTLASSGLTWNLDGVFSNASGGFATTLAQFSASVMSKQPAGNVVTLTPGGTLDFGAYFGGYIIEGVVLDDSGYLSGTPTGSDRNSPANTTWSSGVVHVPDDYCLVTGVGYADTNPVSSTPDTGWIEIFDGHQDTVNWQLTAICKQITANGNYEAKGDWNTIAEYDAGLLTAYKLEIPGIPRLQRSRHPKPILRQSVRRR